MASGSNNNKNNNNGGNGWGWIAGLAGAAAVGFAAYHTINKMTEENSMNKKSFDVITTTEQARSACNLLRSHCAEYNVLGFDCEWVTVHSKRSKVSLVQLSSNEGYTALFRLCQMDQFPMALKELLEDKSIIKTGVGCEIDTKHLVQDYGVYVSGTYDLRFLAVQAQVSAGSLQQLSEDVLNKEMDKDWQISASDWEAPTLTGRQIDYAANDSQTGFKVFKTLYSRVTNNDNPSNYEILSFCYQYNDVNYTPKVQY